MVGRTEEVKKLELRSTCGGRSPPALQRWVWKWQILLVFVWKQKANVLRPLFVLFAVARPIAGGAGQVLRAGQERATAPHAALPRLVSTRQLCKFLSLQVVTTFFFFPLPQPPPPDDDRLGDTAGMNFLFLSRRSFYNFFPSRMKSLTVMFIICPHLMSCTPSRLFFFFFLFFLTLYPPLRFGSDTFVCADSHQFFGSDCQNWPDSPLSSLREILSKCLDAQRAQENKKEEKASSQRERKEKRNLVNSRRRGGG